MQIVDDGVLGGREGGKGHLEISQNHCHSGQALGDADSVWRLPRTSRKDRLRRCWLRALPHWSDTPL